jgi:type IV pilus assembly protein PilM
MTNVFSDFIKPVLNRLQKLLPSLLSNVGSKFSIGLDFGPDRLNLVQMERAGGGICMRAIASLPYPCPRDELYQNPKGLKALLKQAYAMQPFMGKRVVSCLPAEHIKIITVSYKYTEGQPDATPIVAELRERLQGELDDMVVDFITLRQEDTESGKRDALVALAPRKKVMAYLDLLTGAGLDVDALDIGPAALARMVCFAGAIHSPEFPRLPNVLLVNFGAESSFVTVIWGRRLMLDRAVEFSENGMFTRLKQVLDMPEELAIRLLYGNNPYEKTTGAAIENGGKDEASQMVTEVLRPEITLLLQEINKTLVYMASKTRISRSNCRFQWKCLIRCQYSLRKNAD